MEKYDFYVPENVNIENINVLSKEQSVIFEKRICEISELADQAATIASELFASGFGMYEMSLFISDVLKGSFSEPHRNAMPKNFFALNNYLGTLSYYDKTIFASLFTGQLKRCGIGALEKDFLPEVKGNSSVIYVKNRLSDEAYDVFSDNIEDTTVSYAETLRDAAQAVADGKKEYAILPLEEKGGARLAGIAALLFKHDLKIASVTPVFGFDGSEDVKYALVSKSFKIPGVASDDDRYLEIRFRADGQVPLSALLSAAEMLGVTLYRINTVKFDTDEGEIPFYTIVFKRVGTDFSELLMFLTIFIGSYTAIGIYKNLES